MALAARLLLNCNKFPLLRANTVSWIRPQMLRAVTTSPVSSCLAGKNLGLQFDERNIKLGRPQSPHLTIYSPQITSMMSISHRISGMILASYFAAFSTITFALPEDFMHYVNAIESSGISGASIFTLKFLLALPLSYHWFNAIRHLLWDFGYFLTLKQVYSTGYTVLGLSFATAIGLCLL